MDRVKRHLKHMGGIISGQKIRINVLKLLEIVLIVIFIYMLPTVYNSYELNNDLQKSRNFRVSFEYRFNETDTDNPDIMIDLNINHNRKILLVDEPFEISGNAILRTSKAQEIDTIIIGFQNAQAFPIRQDIWGITQPGFITLKKTQQNNKLVGKTQIVWTLEGTYYPYIKIYLTNTTTIPSYCTETQDIFITVYPKTQLTQIATNKASFILAFAVFMLTFIGIIISIIYTFHDKSYSIDNSSCKKQNNTETSNNKKNNTEIGRDCIVDIHQERQNGKTDTNNR